MPVVSDKSGMTCCIKEKDIEDDKWLKDAEIKFVMDHELAIRCTNYMMKTNLSHSLASRAKQCINNHNIGNYKPQVVDQKPGDYSVK